MNSNLQRTLRIIIPGVFMIVIVAWVLSPYTLIIESVKDITSNILNKSWIIVLALALGYPYHAFLRPKMVLAIWEDVDLNIKKKLLYLAHEDIPEETTKALIAKKHLMHIFYSLIDNDKSLSIKSESIRVNGIALTSSFDLWVFSSIGIVISILLFAFLIPPDGKTTLELTNFLSNFCLFAFFFLLAPILTEFFKLRHIKLSNEQLESIYVNYKSEAKDKIVSSLL